MVIPQPSYRVGILSEIKGSNLFASLSTSYAFLCKSESERLKSKPGMLKAKNNQDFLCLWTTVSNVERLGAPSAWGPKDSRRAVREPRCP